MWSVFAFLCFINSRTSVRSLTSGCCKMLFSIRQVLHYRLITTRRVHLIWRKNPTPLHHLKPTGDEFRLHFSICDGTKYHLETNLSFSLLPCTCLFISTQPCEGVPGEYWLVLRLCVLWILHHFLLCTVASHYLFQDDPTPVDRSYLFQCDLAWLFLYRLSSLWCFALLKTGCWPTLFRYA